jgi:hypothetical protein
MSEGLSYLYSKLALALVRPIFTVHWLSRIADDILLLNWRREVPALRSARESAKAFA